MPEYFMCLVHVNEELRPARGAVYHLADEQVVALLDDEGRIFRAIGGRTDIAAAVETPEIWRAEEA